VYIRVENKQIVSASLVTPAKVNPLAFTGVLLEAGYTIELSSMLAVGSPTCGFQLHVILISAVAFGYLNSSKCIQD